MILFQRFKCPDLFNTGRARKQQRHIHDWIYRRGNRSSGKMIPLQLPIEDKNFYKDLLYELNNFFKGKCAFCECLFVEKGPGEFTQNPTLLYYRPVTKYKNKTPNYIWLSWQWSNMYLACETCSKYYNGEVPSNYPENDNPRTFPTISGIHAEPGVFGIKELVEKESPYYLDPCLDNPAGYLRFIWQEAKNQVDIEAIGDGERGQKTIKAFGLDRPELCESRAIELAKFRTRFEHVLDLAAKGESKELSSATKSLFNGCKPDQPFAGMKRQFLLEWINNDIKTSSWLAKWQTDIKEIEDWQSNPLREFPPICPKLDTRSSTSLESSDTIEKPKIDVLQDVSLGYDESETGKIKLILRKMFKNYERVMVKKEFGEGFSAGHVFLVGAISQTGQGDLPAVVKIGPSNLIKQEATSFEMHIKNKVPYIAGITDKYYHETVGWGGIRYPLVGDEDIFRTQSLRQFLQECADSDVKYILQQRLFKSMSKLWSYQSKRADVVLRRSYDRILPSNLVIEWKDRSEITGPDPEIISAEEVREIVYGSDNKNKLLSNIEGQVITLQGFQLAEVENSDLTLNLPFHSADLLTGSYSFRVRIKSVGEEILNEPGSIVQYPVYGLVTKTRETLLQEYAKDAFPNLDLTSQKLLFPGIPKSLPNPLHVVKKALNQSMNIQLAPIHGDMHLENVLVEFDNVSRNVYLIDFALARIDHVLHDFLRLETSIWLYLVSHIFRLEEEKDRASAFASLFHIFRSLIPFKQNDERITPQLKRASEIICLIRNETMKYLGDKGEWHIYFCGLLIYGLGALKFRNLNTHTRQVAFTLAAMAAERCEL